MVCYGGVKLEKTNEKIQKLKEMFKGKKGLELLITIVIIAIIAGIYLSTLQKQDTGKTQKESSSLTLADYAERTEKRLKEVLSAIEGAGNVEVMITYESGPEIIPVVDSSTQKNSTESTSQDSTSLNTSETESAKAVTVQQQSGAEPIVLMEKQPKVRGVIVIAQGANNMRVKIEVQQAVKTVLDVSLNCIDVFTMKSNNKE
jgi:stage III sporulation protein AG